MGCIEMKIFVHISSLTHMLITRLRTYYRYSNIVNNFPMVVNNVVNFHAGVHYFRNAFTYISNTSLRTCRLLVHERLVGREFVSDFWKFWKTFLWF